MTTTSSCYTSSNDTRSLAALLQEAVAYIQDDKFHPILYQALAGLHQYIGGHQERMMRKMAEVASVNSGQLGDEENHHHHQQTTKTSLREQEEATEENQGHDMTANQNIEVTMDENDADLVHVILDGPDDQRDNSVASEEKDSSEANGSIKDEILGEKEEMKDPVAQVGEGKHISERTDLHVSGPAHTRYSRRQETEEKSQEMEEDPKDNREDQVKNEALKDQNLSNQCPKQHPVKQPEQQRQPQQPKKSSVAVVPPNNNSTPAELLVEHQKKLAAERRRQDVELQRKLARVEQKQRDLQAKRGFLEKEQRKQELVAQSQQPGSVASSNAKESLRQIAKQLATVNTEIQQQRIEVIRIKAEIEKRKQQQEHHAANSSLHHRDTEDLIMLQQKRLEEQARLEQTLEAQKMAAAEKRRRELEEQRRKARVEQRKKDQAKKRRFLEQEQRKQDLIAQARAGGKTTAEKDSVLLQKLSTQMSELDAEVERKRSEEAKNEPGVEEEQEEPQELPQVDTRQASLNRIQVHLPPSSGDERIRGANEHSPLKNSTAEPRAPPSFIPSHHYHEHEKQPTCTSLYQEQQQQYAPGQPSQSPYLHQQYPHLPRQPPESQPLHQQQKHPDEQQTGHAHAHFGSSDQIPTSSSHQPGTSIPQASSPRSETKHDPSDPYSHPHHPPTGSDQKYTKMAEQNDGSDESSMSDLKRNILLQWALQPPYMQCLRPIDELLKTIHQVYPPAHALPPHSYFGGWQTISDTDLLDPTTAKLDEKNLSKAVRKLRFFLHPDKLPADLTAEHQFMCKLLWDVTNDAWEDHKRAKEELDWMHN